MLKKIVLFIVGALLLCACEQDKKATIQYAADNLFELAAPKIVVDSLLFSKSAKVSAVFHMKDAQVRYTTDGSPVTSKSNLYTEPLLVEEATQFAFCSFHPDYKKSEEVYTRLIQLQRNISNAQVTLDPAPHSNYTGNGAQGLVDLQKGTLQFRGTHTWLGFQNDQISIKLDFDKELPISKLIVSTLKDHGSWIFAPQAIEVRAKGRKIGELNLDHPTEMEPKQIELLDIFVAEASYKNIEIKIDLMEEIPEWHQGKGTVPFLFIDEILVE
ncbi:chitobiase/beta-hexosaminidase C-terminal domain-containing protein [Maribacter sp. R77961]|uniref:chitobiase/beta-hexosaminidase C-terminal domain-containing protein n=1 Tax=Maribacter sp. R77961 TaxID=3093871 RepID=UPI0037C903E6